MDPRGVAEKEYPFFVSIDFGRGRLQAHWCNQISHYSIRKSEQCPRVGNGTYIHASLKSGTVVHESVTGFSS